MKEFKLTKQHILYALLCLLVLFVSDMRLENRIENLEKNTIQCEATK